MSELLKKACDYEAAQLARIPAEERPAFHLTGGCGWINDPNGFSCYNGEYHLFFQYHPYSNIWGPMHWGHAKSRDFLKWERLPIALAPDEAYDNAGCFSGSAVELPDGRHLLMYTGVRTDGEEQVQTQCLALGNGTDYVKYSGNPVIRPADIPMGCRESDFRDPKLWRGEDGLYYVVAAAMTKEGNGRIVMFRSGDAFQWEFCGILAESTAKLGGMWECPDFFELDGKQVLFVSPMAMLPEGLEFHVGHNTLALIGSYDSGTFRFAAERMQPIDNGIDFYAPQTIRTPDGRRVMIGWMQAWSNSKFVPPGVKYFGQLSVPRELHVRNGRLLQEPVRELGAYRRGKVLFENVPVAGEPVLLPGVEGRILDLTVTVRELSELKKLTIQVAADETYHTAVSYIPKRGILRLDRNYSGYLYDIVHSRDIPVETADGRLRLRFVMDRYSLEIFVGDGERTGTMSLFTPLSAWGIRFFAEGKTSVDVEKYELHFE